MENLQKKGLFHKEATPRKYEGAILIQFAFETAPSKSTALWYPKKAPQNQPRRRGAKISCRWVLRFNFPFWRLSYTLTRPCHNAVSLSQATQSPVSTCSHCSFPFSTALQWLLGQPRRLLRRHRRVHAPALPRRLPGAVLCGLPPQACCVVCTPQDQSGVRPDEQRFRVYQSLLQQ